MRTTTMPALFREAISSSGFTSIDQWWSGLDQNARSEILDLWYCCSDNYLSDSSRRANVLVFQVEGEFVDSLDAEPDQGWHSDYYEYLVNHEIYLYKAPVFHICTQHPVAKEIAQRGILPADFICPLCDSECPMRKVLNRFPGKSLRLRLSWFLPG